MPADRSVVPLPAMPAPEALTARLTRWRFWLGLALALLLAALLVEAAHKVMTELSYGAVVAAARATPAGVLLASVLATGLSFLALTLYDRSALQYAGARLPYRVVAQTSFIAYALSNTVGLGVLTGGAVRLRLYGAAGLEAGQISRVIAFNAVGFTAGIAVVGAAALVWRAGAVADLLGWPPDLLRAAGVVTLLVAAAALGAFWRGGTWKLRGWSVRLPSASLAMQQLLISALDVTAAAAALWVLLPAGSVAFPTFVGFYALAIAVGVISHVPGGLGVFEAVLLLALGKQVPADQLVGALVLYRVIYHLLPLALALLLLVAASWRRGAATPLVRAAAALSPLLLSAFTFVIGVLLLVSGVTPATEDATAHLQRFMPLPVVEAAHFLGSVIGLALLFVARGMLLRLDVAWWAGLVLALASLVLCLPKGIAVSEAVLLGLLAVSLALSRRHFNRRAALFSLAFSRGWLLAVAAVVGAVAALLFFVYRDVPYADQVWWQFEFDAYAPRSLRAMVAVALLTLCVALAHLLHRAPPPLARPDAAALAQAQAIVAAQDSAGAGLALMGDKSLLFAESGQAFLMYARKGRSWVALYDPVGPREAWPELVWRFVELARESGGRPAFYQVRPQALPVYLDAGLRVYKLGECASVDLASFSLEGKRRANLRHGVARAQRDGLAFEWLPAGAAGPVFDALQAVSDDWLGQHQAAEKAFSLGAFERGYVERQPVAVVRHEGRIVAFATLLVTGQAAEAAVDLMRQRRDAPKTTMDFLFTQIILQLKAQGVACFNLGMVPLSGMAGHRLAPGWQRLGRLLFNHGENFYNFQGLRAFKEKFDPLWEPRYLAAPGGLAPFLVLSDTAALIAGGWRRVVSK
ncbi:bifunctional lysylphosphatidylglycerol flippase/synthetase MprF [Hydrogenophaga sp. NFH-34]|uniref:bifunctional lysylphosphatidylglycerol flippase/synthetase MprF n=1 Tax=Hydrogenophaga sp. NFH-34 TaxID=2744446 RepID=UPI001F1BFCF2|nr:bifunctional lysylphosphatidylglycerol flippase/synthetase MprF [Hydrogenophaga sp. NFH-34]